MASENGWEPARAGADILQWITVPGTDVSLQLMKGAPLQIMRAYAADYNAYVEPLRDADSAAFTPTNSVATSNHLNGTAMDLNWNSHPFRISNAGYTPQMIATMRDLLSFYEDTMFWAQDWDVPKDAMHHQMGYGTYQNRNTTVADFIRRKIRADGYSTFRRDTWAPVAGELTGEEPPMATAEDVARELTSGSEVVLYEGADWPKGELRTGRMRVWLERLAWDLLRVQDGVDHNRAGDGTSKKLGLRDSVRRIVFETTLWTPMISLAELVTQRGSRETTHGHALKAASYGDATIRNLGRIADKLDVDISDLLD